MKRLLFCLAVMLATFPALASKIALSPVVIRAPEQAQTTVFQLHNLGTNPAFYQVSVLVWRQDGLTETEVPTRDVMASPTVLEVAPGAKRVVRLMKLKPGAGAFRLSVREILKPSSASGIRTAVSFSVPVLFESATATPTLTAQRQAGQLVITNTGTGAAQITAIGAVSAKPAKEGMLGWLLPGGTKRFDFAPAGDVVLKVNGRPLTLSVR